ncbi:MAG: ABC transporter substrate-binding protein, partial [Clostridiales bacterium]|nr:ABC transporter substrate-binding protein [Clostridiales bacterium]
MKSIINKMALIVLLLVVSIITSSCGVKTQNETLVIADQFGLAYAPIEIMKAKDFLRQELDEVGAHEVVVEWKRMGNTTS